ncbi:hypothetical protein VB618_00135 [Microvirga sp. CF3062]|uniref:hypothetical protein n=1 Tax=Microvirga sp. CF3062 TaxID=3110182 RepID=UPI002E7620A7|nr:hypothetical protein [Microvirga sp. CF3062]MEE1654586.1 hypothetical protein [Microvirga sp. CF3062]
MRVAAWTIVIIVMHGTPATLTPVVAAISVAIPSVAVVIPPSTPVIVVISRWAISRWALAPGRRSYQGQSRC